MMTPRRSFLSTFTVAGGGMAAAVIGSTIFKGGREGGASFFLPSPVRAEGEKARRPAKGEIDSLLEMSEEELWPEVDPPYVKSDFARLDETDDGLFYDAPKVGRRGGGANGWRKYAYSLTDAPSLSPFFSSFLSPSFS